MRQKKSGKFLNWTILHFEKRESQKNKKGEKAREIIFTMKSTIIVSITFLTLLVTLINSC